MVVVVVVVMGGVPGLRAGLVEVVVQGDGRVRVSGKREVRVGRRQGAAQRRGDGRLVGTVPKGWRETSLAHGERGICGDGTDGAWLQVSATTLSIQTKHALFLYETKD